MTVLVVYAKGRPEAGRQVANELGRVGDQAALLLTEKEYKGRESQIPTDQPVVFVGLSQPAKHLLGTTEIAFSKWGAECRIAGKRAILDCRWTKELRHARAREMARTMARDVKKYTGLDHAGVLANKIPDPPSVKRKKAASKGQTWDEGSLDFVKRWSGWDLGEDHFGDQDIEDKFREVQYLWAVSRFAHDYLSTFAED